MVGRTLGDSIKVPLRGFNANSLLATMDSTYENYDLFQIAFAKRPAEELYDLRLDPFQLNNVASLPKYAEIKRDLSAQLQEYTAETGDPRALGKDALWDNYPIYYDRPINKNWYDFIDSWKPTE